VLVGWGMASAAYPVYRMPAEAAATLQPDGTVVVGTASHDLGTGTYTVMAQIAADALGLPAARVRVELGDTDLPPAPVSGGSITVGTVGPAVQAAARRLRDEMVALALHHADSPMKGARAGDIEAVEGALVLRGTRRRLGFDAIARLHGATPLRVTARSEPGEAAARYAMHAFGAVFAEVEVDAALGTVRVTRVVGAYAGGTVINPATARSQLAGGIVWGIGMALHEKTEIDWRHGRAVNASLADYHVPVNADIGEIDVILVDEHDPHVNPLGAKGLGEIGIVGVAAAVANAVCHATGRRIRALPITPDRLVGR
jgi:xanthine dehydrogenase YagR molybdenum-binding subunit